MSKDEQLLYQEEINKSNYRTLRFFAWVWLPLSVVIIFAQGVSGNITPCHIAAFIMFAYFLGISLLAWFYKPDTYRYSTRMVYMVQIVPLVISVLLGTFLDPAYQAITIFCFLTMMPLLILDKKRNVILWLVFWAAAFLVCSFICKEYPKFRGDLMHTLEFGLISAGVSIMVIDSRMKSIKNYVRALPSIIDPLTGLQNMRKFLEASKKIREDAEGSLSIAYFNTAGLKKYNARFGYQAGSDLLKQIADLLAATYGKDNCARFADDHFVVLAESDVIHRSIEDVTARAGRLGKDCPVQAGVYELHADDRMEIACDRAKSAVDSLKGRHDKVAVQYYDAAFQGEEEHRRYIQDHLEEAIKKGWIQTYFQPIIRSSTNHVCNMEALARWNDPVLGLLPPARFIPILEESKNLHLLDLEIVRQAVKIIVQQKKEGLPESPISVNISRYDFKNVDMVESIKEIVDAAGIPHRMLVAEITESALLKQEDLIAREIDRFHEEGFQVWMDDFGSGWSSLNLLTKFHFDQIKLDMQFALHIHENDNNRLVVKHMIELAQQLGIDTLAEGIETEEHYKILKELGCDKLQGYYYSKPIPADQVIELLRMKNSIPFEQDQERIYYKTIGSVSFANALASHHQMTNEKYGVEIPMAILECNTDKGMRILRANEHFNSFIDHYKFAEEDFNVGIVKLKTEASDAFSSVGLSAVSSGAWTKVTEITVQDICITAFARHVCHNPVTESDAIFFALIDYHSADKRLSDETQGIADR